MRKIVVKDVEDPDLIREIKKLEKNYVKSLTTIANYAEIIEYEPRESILNLGEELKYLYFIIKGRAKIYMVHENGKRSLLQFIYAKDLIGELSLLEVEKQTKDIVAIDKVTCLAIPLSIAKSILLQDNQFMNHLSKYLAEKLLFRVNHFTNNQNYELKYRLATYILKVEVNGIYSEKNTETADFLGVSYRHLLHTLSLFQQEGVLIKTGKSYLIDKEELQKLEIKNYF